MSRFERFLSLWVGLCILAGVALGHLVPALFASLRRIHQRPTGLIITLIVNWLVKPFTLTT